MVRANVALEVVHAVPRGKPPREQVRAILSVWEFAGSHAEAPKPHQLGFLVASCEMRLRIQIAENSEKLCTNSFRQLFPPIQDYLEHDTRSSVASSNSAGI